MYAIRSYYGVRYLGRKGSLAAILRGLGGLDTAERPRAGKLANEVKVRVEAALDSYNFV